MLTPIAGCPALSRVVDSLSAADLHSVVVTVAPALMADVERALAGTAATVLAAPDGDGLPTAVEHLRAEAVSHVLVADPRQVLISPQVIERVRAALAGGAAKVVPIVPVTDTVKTVDAQGRILATVDRSALRTAQYPYGAAVDALADVDIVTVEGDPDAILADLPADTALIEALIACR
ncbi:2-C-methyl-D-erythritol 4-phosphate cytidylyltransferase [Mycolicibacterium fluoranthenivorans]|uniref:2-C-methyl-D-erythritol 4-phosphate cytidylyltransferase n=1 Tax=Mycolicibacterium fluoranthenivorans TaxID=258505 RepID=A0A7G8PBL1_9MYCO|nr:2-C-methyl-D-erythritol 4-phosphate cytidylyltransferase [Mycolicibacterium fluoranthenivorans]QNJ91727.1 2-C-methyl-D-erythritol 4-phosphate cytidylyltransferase [Mycolicibacterium fluoranthenivorans]